jgi:hypothetical protein
MYTHIPYSEQDAMAALVQLGEMRYAVNLLPQLLSYSGYPPADFLVATLGEYGNEEVIPLLDELLATQTDEKMLAMLEQAKEQVRSRIKP